ncbi:MAG: phosphatidate cytidylyltransferase [bacterium]
MERSNLFYRVVTSLVLIPIALLIIFKANIYVVFGLLYVIMVGSVLEFAKIVKVEGVEKVFLLLTSTMTLLYTSFSQTDYTVYFALLFIIVAIFSLFLFGYRNYVERVGKHLFCNLYIPFLLSFSFKLINLDKGRYWLFFLLVVNWLTDSSAYLFGTKFGKHKLTQISPKKSVEGLLGGILGAVVAGLLTNALLFQSEKWVYFVLISFSGAILGQIGDLVESGIKRSEGIKDSGSIIPGHGGFLDRFDSLIFTGPLFYIFATLGVI